MDMHDCDICLSAGSVNQWGLCEVCGEELEEVTTLEEAIADQDIPPAPAPAGKGC